MAPKQAVCSLPIAYHILCITQCILQVSFPPLELGDRSCCSQFTLYLAELVFSSSHIQVFFQQLNGSFLYLIFNVYLLLGDGAGLRDYVISMGVLPHLFQFINDDYISLTFLRNITWVLVNMCRSKSPPLDLEIVQMLLPVLRSLLNHQDCNVGTLLPPCYINWYITCTSIRVTLCYTACVYYVCILDLVYFKIK